MNTRIKIGDGTLTMCDIWDFRETLDEDHTVYTLCKYKPKFIDTDEQERYHFYFRAYDYKSDAWIIAAKHIENLLGEGKNVLLHCVHGRDRTGGVAYIILRRYGLSHDETTSIMKEHRPSMKDAWDFKLEMREHFYEAILKDAEDYIGHREDYLTHESNSKKGIPYHRI